MKVAILTISDRGARGEREDKSGKVIEKLLETIGAETPAYRIVPDEQDAIEAALREFIDESIELILTTGGTGVAPRDVTPEATRAVIEKELPGFAEAMRMESFKITPKAIISRAIAGTARESLIINLPGSPKAVRECLELILPAIPHTVELIKGEVIDCAETKQGHNLHSASL